MTQKKCISKAGTNQIEESKKESQEFIVVVFGNQTDNISKKQEQNCFNHFNQKNNLTNAIERVTRRNNTGDVL